MPLTFVVILVLVSLMAPPARANTEAERRTLKGLGDITVVVEDITPEVERAGLEGSTVRTDVESRLRLAGITVSPRAPAHLYVNVHVVRSVPGLYAYHIALELAQEVAITRLSAMVTLATTWSGSGITGTVGAAKLLTVRESVRDVVDEFINAYFAVNPKP